MNRIMVVDDAQFMRVRLSKLLKGHGFDVTEAENGLQAVNTYRTVRPDAVLMDITMPEKDWRISAHLTPTPRSSCLRLWARSLWSFRPSKAEPEIMW